MSLTRYFDSPRGVIAALLIATFTSCVDAPSAPEGAVPSTSVAFLPALSLVGPGGAVEMSPAQADALDEAFDRVDRFRMVVRRASSGEIVVDTIIQVTPGQNSYDLSVQVDATGQEQFTITITALQGDMELFSADPVTVTAVPATTPGDTPPPTTPTNVALEYTGPGATATALLLSPSSAVLAPGASAQFAAQVQDQNGDPIEDVPLSWSVEATEVVSHDGNGTVTGTGDGAVALTVGSPSGLETTAWVYVVGGTLAYVEGGDLKVRGAAAGTPEVRAQGGASAPAWTADASRLYYVQAGRVFRTGTPESLVEGNWPQPSPDGTKLALDGVVFANDDGSRHADGPAGSTPVWVDGETLLVAGGSIQQVRADGSGRTAVVVGEATFPALGAGGRIAYVSGGELRVVGVEGALATGVSGRPTWSPDGLWLAVRGAGGINLVPVSGDAPPVPLPGLDGASDPAFRPAGSLAPPASVNLTGFDPAAPLPGASVTILGSGFDWIIPENNHVVWPTVEGVEEVEIGRVTPTGIEVVVPRSAARGQVQVTTRTGTGVLAFEPTLGSLNVTAVTRSGDNVEGVIVVVTLDGTEVARGVTGGEGTLLVPGLQPGTYTVTSTAPGGYALIGDPIQVVEVTAGSTPVDLLLQPAIQALVVSPEDLTVEVGSSLAIQLTLLDVNGNEISVTDPPVWNTVSTNLAVVGDGLAARVVANAPGTGAGASQIRVEIDGRSFLLGFTVTSYIEGTVIRDVDPAAGGGTQPAAGVSVNVTQDGNRVGTAVTDGLGAYRVPGLFEGMYDVAATPTPDRSPVPATQAVVLDRAHPTGTADFLMSRAQVASLVLDAGDAELDFIDDALSVGVTPLDKDAIPLIGRIATFESSAPGVATVDAAGKVTAIDNGTAWIRVTVDGVVDSVQVTVDQKAVKIIILDDDGVEPEADSFQVIVGDTGTALWKADDATAHPIMHKVPTFRSTDTGVATIDAAGHATVVGVGRTEIIVEMDLVADTLTLIAFDEWVGNLYDTDLPAFFAGQYGRVQGDVVISSTGLTNVNALINLIEVTGSVVIESNPSLGDLVGLINLRWVEGSVILRNNDALTSPVGPPAALEWVGGDFVVEDNLSITNADVFANLEGVGGGVEVIRNAALTNLAGLLALDFAGDYVLLAENASLSNRGNFPFLKHVGPGGLMIEGGGQVLGFPLLESIAGPLTIGGVLYDLTILHEAYFPALFCVGGGIDVYSNPNLTKLDFPSLDFVGSGCGAPPPPVAVVAISPWSEPITLGGTRGGGPASPDRAEQRRAAAFRPSADLNGEGSRDALSRRRTRAAGIDQLKREHDRIEGKQPAETPLTALARPRADVGVSARIEQKLSELQAERTKAKRPRPAIPEPDRALALVVGGPGIDLYSNPMLSTLNFGALRHVEGGMSFHALDALPSIMLPVLESVGAWLELYGLTGTTSFSAPMLIGVGGDLDVYNNSGLQTLGLPLLDHVDASLYLSGNAVLQTLSLPSLTYVGLDFDIYSNTVMAAVALPILRHVDNDFYTWYNDGLQDFQVATASNLFVGRAVDIYDNPSLATINIPGLNHTGDDLEIDYNQGLVSITIATATTLNVGYDIRIYENYPTHPWTVSIPGLVYVFDDVDVSSNDMLTSVTMATGDPATVDYRVRMSHNTHLQTVSFPNLVHVEQDLQFFYNPALTSVAFPAVNFVGSDLWMDHNGTPGSFTTDFSSLQEVRSDILATFNDGLANYNFPALTKIGGDFWIYGNKDLRSLSADILQTLPGSLWLYDNDALTSFTMPSLVESFGFMEVYSNGALTSFALPALDRMQSAPALAALAAAPSASTAEDVYIEDNDALTSVDLKKLSDVGVLNFDGNDALVDLPSLPSLGTGTTVQIKNNLLLKNVAGLASHAELFGVVIQGNPVLNNLLGLSALTSVVELRINDSAALTSIDQLTSLTRVWEILNLFSNSALTSISFPNLAILGDGLGPNMYLGNLSIDSNPVLTSASFPALAELDGHLFISNSQLADLNGFAALTSPIYKLSILGNVFLRDVTGLNGIGEFGTTPSVTQFTIDGNTGLTDAAGIALKDQIELNNEGIGDDVPTWTVTGNDPL